MLGLSLRSCIVSRFIGRTPHEASSERDFITAETFPERILLPKFLALSSECFGLFEWFLRRSCNALASERSSFISTTTTTTTTTTITNMASSSLVAKKSCVSDILVECHDAISGITRFTNVFESSMPLIGTLLVGKSSILKQKGQTLEARHRCRRQLYLLLLFFSKIFQILKCA